MTNPNDCAFPFDRNKTIVAGLTKREYFAAMALQGMVASHLGGTWETLAKVSVIAADALIKELNEPNQDLK